MRSACLDENEIAELFGGTGEAGWRDEAEQHLDRCESCRELLAGLAALDEGPTPMGAGLGDTVEPAPNASGGDRIEVGTRVDHFEVTAYVGGGAMGEVYAARDTKLDRKVALKVVRRELLGSREAIARFQREARATARFNHPNIVTIHEVGEHQGQPYVALEHLEGITLHERLSEGPLPLPEALRIGEGIALGLAEAHRHGVLHRDLKPGNVHLGVGGNVRVLDFGLAKFLSGAEAATQEAGAIAPIHEGSIFATVASQITGTPTHMAPEQWRGAEVSPATDVWALGMILHRMIAGRSPLNGSTIQELAAQVTSETPLPRLTSADAPAGLVSVTNDCLSKDVSARPELSSVLGAIDAARTPATEPRRTWRSIAIAGLGAAAVAAIAATTLTSRQPTPADEPVAEGKGAARAAAPTNVPATPPPPEAKPAEPPVSAPDEPAKQPDPVEPPPVPLEKRPKPAGKTKRRVSKKDLFGTRE
ncbi:MAG: serine/threonine-protein kinase [Myxococcota bacterium]